MEPIMIEEYKGHKIKVYYDDDPFDPRENDNIATFVCEHRNYVLGDEHCIEDAVSELFDSLVTSQQIINYFVSDRQAVLRNDEHDYYYSWNENGNERNSDCFPATADTDEIAEVLTDELYSQDKLNLVEASGEVAIQPISMYDHSGISIWLGGYSGHPDARWDCGTLGFAYIAKATAEEEMPNFSEETWKEWANQIMKGEMKEYAAYVSGQVYGYMIEALDDDEGCDDSCWGYYDESYMLEDAKANIDAYVAKATKKREEVLAILNKVRNIDVLAGLKFVDGNHLYYFHKIGSCGTLAVVEEIGDDGIIGVPQSMNFTKLSNRALSIINKYYDEHNK